MNSSRGPTLIPRRLSTDGCARARSRPRSARGCGSPPSGPAGRARSVRSWPSSMMAPCSSSSRTRARTGWCARCSRRRATRSCSTRPTRARRCSPRRSVSAASTPEPRACGDMSRREQIRMSDEEVAAFLETHRVAICATNGKDGWPHLMPLWYVLRDGDLWSWTYAKSQKVRNFERDDRATLEVETGHEYHELRGVMIRARCNLHRELELVAGVGQELAVRYGGAHSPVGPDARAGVVRPPATRV